MKTTIIIILASVFLMYLQKVRIHYRNTFRAATQRYGLRTAKRSRKGMAIRACLWAVPYKVYYWKQVLWDLKAKKLAQEGTEDQ